MAKETALITGASAGLGAEFAQQLAAAHYDLVLVARDAVRLENKAVRLRQDFGIHVEVLPADLLTADGVTSVRARLAHRSHPVTMLVNNAGFGLVTPFDMSPLADELDQLDLLVRVPLELSHAALASMLEFGHGRIINVSSVSGFVPRGSYGAAKAWVISFSRWANIAYGRRGVSVTAVCPGFVHTEFQERMGASTARIPGWMWLRADRVVREGLAAAWAGKGVSIPSKRYTFLANMSKFVPARLSTAAGNRGR